MEEWVANSSKWFFFHFQILPINPDVTCLLPKIGALYQKCQILINIKHLHIKSRKNLTLKWKNTYLEDQYLTWHTFCNILLTNSNFKVKLIYSDKATKIWWNTQTFLTPLSNFWQELKNILTLYNYLLFYVSSLKEMKMLWQFI